jgi:hypothetical protein
MEGPMLPDQPWLQRHPETGELFWWDECELVAEEPLNTYSVFREELPLAYQKLPFAEEPTLDHYRQALDTGIASSKKKKLYVLMRYWWLVNDAVRHGKAGISKPPDFRERLLQVRTLLNINNPTDRLSSAEVARQLGDFATAKKLMKFRFPKSYAPTVALIKKLIGEENTALHEIT